MANNCNCFGITPTPPPACPGKGKCLSMADIFFPCPNLVGPCGMQGEIDMFDSGNPAKPLCHKYSICGTGVKPTLKVVNDGFDKTVLESAVIVTVGSSTRLRYVTKTGTQDKTTIVYVRACCGIYAMIFKVYICIQNLCNGCPTCGPGTKCNPCSGICEDIAIDMSTQNPTTNGYDFIDVSVI